MDDHLGSEAVDMQPKSSEQVLAASMGEGAASYVQRLKFAAQTAIVAAEVLPVNEAMRYGSALATQAATGNSTLAATALGVSTLAIEWLAADSTASLMGTNRGMRTFKRLNEKTERITKGRKMSPPVEVGVAYFGGSAVVLVAKQIESPDRTVKQNKRHGRLTAIWLSSLLTVQYGLAANGIQNPSAATIGGALAVTAGGAAGVKMVQKLHASNKRSEAL